MAGSQSGNQFQRGAGDHGRQEGPGWSDQAQSALRNASDTASELWDDAYEQGRRYYREGGQMVGNLDAATLTGWLVAGGIGFGLAWLIFGQGSWGTDDVARRMSQSSGNDPRRR
jgi:hypothetical protein